MLRMTSSMTLKKSMTGLALAPKDPSTVPKVRQKKMMPRVLVPDLYVSCLAKTTVSLLVMLMYLV